MALPHRPNAFAQNDDDDHHHHDGHHDDEDGDYGQLQKPQSWKKYVKGVFPGLSGQYFFQKKLTDKS